MKKILKSLSVLGIATLAVFGTVTFVQAQTSGGITVPQGGTGFTAIPAGTLLVGGSQLHLSGTTSPTVGYITATSTATSTFAGGIKLNGGCVSVLGICLGTSNGQGNVPGGYAILNAATSSYMTASYSQLPTDSYGDSITNGVGASVQSNAYVNRIGSSTDSIFVNHGESSRTLVDLLRETIYVHVVATSSIATTLFGYNDMRYEGTSAVGLTGWTQEVMAAYAYLAIPDSMKTWADTGGPYGSFTFDAGWGLAGALYGNHGTFQATAIGSTATTTQYGTAIYVGYTAFPGVATTLDVNIDGVDYGNINQGTSGGHSNDGYSFYPAAARFGGLQNSVHTVVLKDTGGQVYLDYVSSNGGVRDITMPRVFAGNVLRMTASTYAISGSSPYNAGSDAAVAMFNQIGLNTVNLLASDGLSIVYVDASSEYIPEANQITGVHPNDLGHLNIARAFLSAMNQSITPYERQGAIAANVLSQTLSALTVGQPLIATGFGSVATTPTTTATCAGNATCNPFTIFGSSPITISASGGGGGGGGNVSTSSVPVVGQLAYWTTTTPTPALLSSVATSSESCTSPLSCTAFNHVGPGGAISLGTVGIANGGTGLTTIGASSTVLISNSTNAFWQKLATSQLTNDSGFITSSNNYPGTSTNPSMASYFVSTSTTALNVFAGGVLIPRNMDTSLRSLYDTSNVEEMDYSNSSGSGVRFPNGVDLLGSTLTMNTGTIDLNDGTLCGNDCSGSGASGNVFQGDGGIFSNFSEGLIVNRFGISSSTPGTFLSIGSTTANYINLDAYATSTLTAGINIKNGCYAIAGVCIGGGGGGAVSSVSNSDSTLTVSPTTGSVVASLNLSHANTWSAKQTFSTSNISITGGSNTNLLSTDGSGNLSWTAAGAGSNYFTNSGNNTYLNTGINLEMPFFTATSTTASSSIVTALGIGTTSPWTAFTVASGAILNTETQPATTTSMTVDFRASTNQLIRYSTSAMTITLAGGAVGQHLTLTTCNASTGTGGAITFAGSVSFSGGVQPGNSTQANTCDVWSWLVSQATSTTKYLLIGQTAGLQ